MGDAFPAHFEALLTKSLAIVRDYKSAFDTGVPHAKPLRYYVKLFNTKKVAIDQYKADLCALFSANAPALSDLHRSDAAFLANLTLSLGDNEDVRSKVRFHVSAVANLAKKLDQKRKSNLAPSRLAGYKLCLVRALHAALPEGERGKIAEALAALERGAAGPAGPAAAGPKLTAIDTEQMKGALQDPSFITKLFPALVEGGDHPLAGVLQKTFSLFNDEKALSNLKTTAMHLVNNPALREGLQSIATTIGLPLPEGELFAGMEGDAPGAPSASEAAGPQAPGPGDAQP